MFRFIRTLEDLTKALNRFVDFWGSEQQAEVDDLTARLKVANDRLAIKLTQSQLKGN